MASRQLRKTNRTVLIVVEGETEEAFVQHLKHLYYRRGMRLSISLKNAHGHGPQGVINKLKSAIRMADFEQRIAVLDADIALTVEEAKWLRGQRIATIVSTPAVEATLLAILGKPVPDATEKCKSALQKCAPGDPTDSRYYEKYFPRATLDAAQANVQVLAALITAVATE